MQILSPHIGDNKCRQINYIDCRSWYDFVEQLIALSIACFLTYNVMRHYRNLKKEKQEESISEHQKSIRRKIRVNLIQIIYLFCYEISTIISIFLFFLYQKDINFNQNHSVLQKIYRISEILFINWLNTLNLTVGFLYWKAVRAYYVLSDLDIPLPFRRVVKIFFFIFFCFNGSAIAIAICHLFIYSLFEYHFKLFTLIATVICIGVCIGCRTLYWVHILKKIDLSARAIKKQWIMSILLFTSSLLRIFLYTFDILYYEINGQQWQTYVRNEQETSTGCIDTSPVYAIILLFIDILVNMLPAAIYGHLFVSQIQIKHKKPKQNQQQLLKKNSKESKGSSELYD